MSKWNWIRGTDRTLFNVGILPDGSLHNPNGYPEDDVREAITAAEQRRHERRSNAARKAAVTRKNRRDKLVYAIARAILAGNPTGPRSACRLCGRGLSDAASIDRGIGSECWQ